MKKIGILTFHRAHNYGAVLQCYALQETLKDIGYHVEVVDYRQPYIESVYKPLSLSYISKNWRHPRVLHRYFKKSLNRVEKSSIFSIFMERWITLTAPIDPNRNQMNDIDTYVIGSDQMWGLHCTGGLDPIYFGEFRRAKESKVVGYAISSNTRSIESIDKELMQSYCTNFSELSFREPVIADAVSAKTGLKSRVDIDPTLLTDESHWHKMINDKWSKERYVLLYQVRTPHQDPKLLNRKAAELAEKLGCRVIDMSDMRYSPEDFVSLFKYAEAVVTSSFHASVFSVIFERSLYAVRLKDGHDSRYENILNAIGAEDLLVDMDFTPEPKSVDYRPIKSNLAKLRTESLDYLRGL